MSEPQNYRTASPSLLLDLPSRAFAVSSRRKRAPYAAASLAAIVNLIVMYQTVSCIPYCSDHFSFKEIAPALFERRSASTAEGTFPVATTIDDGGISKLQ
eukprot:6199837-Pleurochrysis_carterae.AAC.1